MRRGIQLFGYFYTGSFPAGRWCGANNTAIEGARKDEYKIEFR
jgi:hypothetical protein